MIVNYKGIEQMSVSALRKTGKRFILFDNFIIVFGFYIVFPMISLHFINNLHWSGWVVGLALGVRQLLQQSLCILGGGMADRFGAKPMIVAGMLMRTISFAIMAYASNPLILILACFFSAVGGALFDPPRTAVIIKITRPHERGRFFSILMIQDSVGTVLGVLVGSWLVNYDFSSLCWAASALFFLAAVSNYYILPDFRTSTVGNSVTQGISVVLRDRKFVIWVITLAGYYVLSVQVLMMLPVVLYDIAKSTHLVTGMYAIESILSVTVLYPVVVWSEKRFSLPARIIFGLIMMIAGLTFIGFIQRTEILLMSITLFYMGSIIVEPARETLNALLANHNARSSYLGFSQLGLAFGGLIGYCGGGSLYDLGKQMGATELPWLLLGAIGVVTTASLYFQFFNQGNIKVKAETNN
ncbi:multidrug efflux MFS transporter MdtH [Erwinia mallotivora]